MDSDSGAALPSPRSDLVTGGVWLVLGAAIAIGSWRMDRLESQGVPWFTAPGLLPGIVGVMIVLTALLIVVRALRRRALPALTGRAGAGAGDERRALASLALCLAFAAGLVGHGVPFWLAASLYLTTHIFLLQYPDRRAAGQVTRGALVAADHRFRRRPRDQPRVPGNLPGPAAVGPSADPRCWKASTRSGARCSRSRASGRSSMRSARRCSASSSAACRDCRRRSPSRC